MRSYGSSGGSSAAPQGRPGTSWPGPQAPGQPAQRAATMVAMLGALKGLRVPSNGV